jgi:transposase
MPRSHGYAPVGVKCYGKSNWSYKQKTNVIGALLGETLISAMLFMCSIAGDIFYNWVVNQLIPVLPKNSIIVMDNASFHKGQDIQDILRQNGHKLIFMPPYSPDLNPIEHLWAKAKAIKRKLQCTTEHLFQFIL